VTVLAAAELMGLSLPQARRIWKRFKAVVELKVTQTFILRSASPSVLTLCRW
jgi:hypothetical protein